MSYKMALLGSVLTATVAVSGGAWAADAPATGKPARAQQVAAADAPVTEVAGMTVSARKREENVQEIPIAITAVTGKQLEEQSILQPSDLARIVPSLVVYPGSSSPDAATIELRGQAPGNYTVNTAQAVGLYIDGIYIPHPNGTNSSFFDLSGVEVLKGPQGTLYGRNTTGGALLITSRDADFSGFHGYGELEAGNYDDFKFTGAVNLPLVEDVLSARVAYQHWNRQGYGVSIITGEHYGGEHDDNIVRLSLRFTPNEKFSSDLKFEYINVNQTNVQQELVDATTGSLGSVPPVLAAEYANEAHLPFAQALSVVQSCINNPNIFITCSPMHQVEKLWSAGVSLTMDYNISDDVKLRSISGYHQFSDFRVEDVINSPGILNGLGLGLGSPQQFPDGTPLNLPWKPEQASTEYTQEFDLSGKIPDRLDWLVGAYVSDDVANGDQNATILPDLTHEIFVPGDVLRLETSSWAFFTEDDVHLTKQLSLTLGARYTHESVTETNAGFNYFTLKPAPFACTSGLLASATPTQTAEAACAVSGATSSEGVSWLASVNFQATPSTLIYFKSAHGFRGGGLQANGGGTSTLLSYQPEAVTDFEFGFKSDFFDHRLRTNLALYQSNYTNKQVTQIIVVNNVNSTITNNAGTARIRGAELEVDAVPLDRWTIYGSATYFTGLYTKYDGATLPAGGVCPAGSLDAIPPGSPAGTMPTCNVSGTGFVDPHWRADVGSRYEIEKVGPGNLSFQADVSWYSHANPNLLTLFPQNSIPLQLNLARGHTLVNARVEYNLPDKGLSIAVFATNLLDNHYQTETTGLLGALDAQTADPRFWGIQVRKTFGNE